MNTFHRRPQDRSEGLRIAHTREAKRRSGVKEEEEGKEKGKGRGKKWKERRDERK